MIVLKPTTTCEVHIVPDRKGGIAVRLRVPTYGGGAEFWMSAERDNDGDWRVFIPWPSDAGDEVRPINTGGDTDAEVCGGILYLGAPDCDVEARWSA